MIQDILWWVNLVRKVFSILGYPALGLIGAVIVGYFSLWIGVSRRLAKIRIVRLNQHDDSASAITYSEKFRQKLLWLLAGNGVVIVVLVVITFGAVALNLSTPRPSPVVGGTIGPGPKVTAYMDGRKMIDFAATHKIMWMCRAFDNRLDYTNDTAIDKSQFFGIRNEEMQIEIPLKVSINNRQQVDETKIQCFLFLLPKGTDSGDIATYRQALAIPESIYVGELALDTNAPLQMHLDPEFRR
jgi:hypothetical protein